MRYHHDMATFDTLRTTQRLREAGFEPAQAEALVAALSDGARDDLATKADIDRVEARIDRLEARLERLEDKVDHAVKDLNAKIERLDDKIERLGNRMLWLIGGALTLGLTFMGICTGLIIAFG